ncbi:MAG: hypothetical protein U0164_02060 [Gemmatimonadaceae bacterium]
MDQSEFIVAMTSILVGGGICLSIVLTIGRLLGRRRDGGELGAAGLGQLDARLSRMEQAIDAMAVEVERVSEAQRFTSKLLADRADDRPVAERIPRS